MEKVVVLQVGCLVLEVLGVGGGARPEGLLGGWRNVGIVSEEGKVGDRSEGIAHRWRIRSNYAEYSIC